MVKNTHQQLNFLMAPKSEDLVRATTISSVNLVGIFFIVNCKLESSVVFKSIKSKVQNPMNRLSSNQHQIDKRSNHTLHTIHNVNDCSEKIGKQFNCST